MEKFILRRFKILELATRRGYVDENGRVDQRRLARALNISEEWLSKILNGRGTPSLDLLISMCTLLDCTIDDVTIYPKAGVLVPA